jgi:hypothetical protein
VHDFVSAGLPSCDESFGRINVPEKKKLWRYGYRQMKE